MTKPITDKAEIALEYPDKFYVGTFECSSRFEAHLDPTGIALTLERPGTDDDVHKSVHMESGDAGWRRYGRSGQDGLLIA